jgi:ribosomal protein L11 methyltransferase
MVTISRLMYPGRSPCEPTLPTRLSSGLVEEIRQALWHYGQIRSVSDLRVSTLKEEDWANAWKAHFQVHQIGERVVIRPPWQEHMPVGDQCGGAGSLAWHSGTGLHPSPRCPCSAWSRW